MPYSKKDEAGKIVGGRFENLQPGIAEDFITEQEWQAYISQSSQDVITATLSLTKRLFKEVQKPNFPWGILYQAALADPNFSTMLNFTLGGLNGNFSIEFVSQRFREMVTYLENHPELPQLTTAHRHIIRQAVINAGIEPDLFLEEPTEPD